MSKFDEIYQKLWEQHREMSHNTTLNHTVDLEEIANFLNQNEIYNGAPVRGAGGWYVHNSEVTNDDAEGGYSGVSVFFSPEEEGLLARKKVEADKYVNTQFKWPIEAKQLEQFMQGKSGGQKSMSDEELLNA